MGFFVSDNWREDVSSLIKLRLNTFVLITTFFGFGLGWKASQDPLSWAVFGNLFHTLLGTALCAFGSAVFNQLMEIESDAQMKRTANRPLPSRRMVPTFAFGIGWTLCALGIIHLGAKISIDAAILGAFTIGTYVFVYTPLKRVSSTNTLVGAIPGAVPPMMGWAGAGHDLSSFAPWILFAVLFLWQLPHFVAINWLCREEYEEAGYKMWSNYDVSGDKSSRLFIFFSILLALLALVPTLFSYTGWLFASVGFISALAMIVPILKFKKSRERTDMRKAFFATLLYLPIALCVLAIDWR